MLYPFRDNTALSLPIQNENGTWEAISFIGFFENILQGKNLLKNLQVMRLIAQLL